MNVQKIPINVFETSEQLVIVAALPGVEADDISVEVKEKKVHIATRERGDDAQKKYVVREWSYGAFDRSFDLQAPIDATQGHAQHRNGVLTLVLPRATSFVGSAMKVADA